MNNRIARLPYFCINAGLGVVSVILQEIFVPKNSEQISTGALAFLVAYHLVVADHSGCKTLA